MRAKKTSDAIRRKAIGSIDVINKVARDLEIAVARFTSGNRSIDFNIDPTADTVWATAQQIADLFGKNVREIEAHIQNLIDNKEFDDSAFRDFQMPIVGGTIIHVKHYDLDVILAVGHQVKSQQATAFRKWAYAILRSYLTHGYALNERRLRSDKQAADDLAVRVRAIRTEEKQLFTRVRDTFKEAASDYDGSAKACRRFYALMQDKFHYAASGMTACELILERADHRQPNMGMTSFLGDRPTVQEAKVGKNYLTENELRILRIVGEQFLLYVESRALRGKTMTMIELIGKFDELLRVNGYEVFVGWEKDYKRERADKHAGAEFARFLVRQRRGAQIEAR